jgi:hypothetical protein
VQECSEVPALNAALGAAGKVEAAEYFGTSFDGAPDLEIEPADESRESVEAGTVSSPPWEDNGVAPWVGVPVIRAFAMLADDPKDVLRRCSPDITKIAKKR